jgi:hypothetical protein
MHRRFLAVVAGVVASIAFSSVALANECVNASKQPEAGAQAILNLVTGEVTVLTEGLQRRIDQGLVDPATGEGFHGLVGFDFDGDGTAEFTTWIVGPDDHIPELAQFNGPACHGVTNIGVFLSECVGG